MHKKMGSPLARSSVRSSGGPGGGGPAGKSQVFKTGGVELQHFYCAGNTKLVSVRYNPTYYDVRVQYCGVVAQLVCLCAVSFVFVRFFLGNWT